MKIKQSYRQHTYLSNRLPVNPLKMSVIAFSIAILTACGGSNGSDSGGSSSTIDPKPSNPKPNDPKPNNPKPNDPKPNDPKPNDPKPNDPKPNDPKPNDPKPNDPKPNDTKPNDTKPNDTKPNDTKPNDTKPNDPKPNDPKPKQAVYDAKLVVATTTPQNLITNGDFEQKVGWESCGDIKFTQSSKYKGKQALAISHSKSCSESSYDSKIQRPVKLNKNAKSYTVSFFVKSTGNEGAFETTQIGFANGNGAYPETAYKFLTADYKDWTQVKYVFDHDELQKELGSLDNVYFYIYQSDHDAGNHTYYIDELNIYNGDISVNNMIAMPSDLRNNNQRITFKNFDAKGGAQISTVSAGGQALKDHKLRLTNATFDDDQKVYEYADGFMGIDGYLTPSIAKNNEITAISRRLFYFPKQGMNAGILKKSYTGIPGYYQAGSSLNKYSINYELSNFDSNATQDRSVVSYFVFNKGGAFDQLVDGTVISRIDIYNHDLTATIKEGIDGSVAKIANDGKIAYLKYDNDGETLFITDKNGKQLKRVVLENNLDYEAQSIAWSADSQKIAILSKGVFGRGVDAKGDSYAYSAILIYDLKTGKLSHSLLIDKGEAVGGLQWVANTPYVLYSKKDEKGATRIYWHNTNTRSTGVMTNLIQAGLLP
ncbi:carbohydrate binding domain-containing protein [Psychrobacter sp. I-STPA10]|uniref:carbohydrate binding domain-containing protein n=1 Tax=Psychrobacter sp. I-STPA10 TaxID=2585769 RepID=UPI001E60A869|nr:carbohydrate binding domain-containing protein [Psychrobacter sp. I-STPA10]